jgi:hypothetical protein
MYDDIENAAPMDASASPRNPRRPRVNVKPRYLITPDAAVHLGLSPRTLEKHRSYGTGPDFRKLGGRVVYAIEDLDSWAALGTRRSTSDPGIGTVHPAKHIAEPLQKPIERRR